MKMLRNIVGRLRGESKESTATGEKAYVKSQTNPLKTNESNRDADKSLKDDEHMSASDATFWTTMQSTTSENEKDNSTSGSKTETIVVSMTSDAEEDKPTSDAKTGTTAVTMTSDDEEDKPTSGAKTGTTVVSMTSEDKEDKPTSDAKTETAVVSMTSEDKEDKLTTDAKTGTTTVSIPSEDEEDKPRSDKKFGTTVVWLLSAVEEDKPASDSMPGTSATPIPPENPKSDIKSESAEVPVSLEDKEQPPKSSEENIKSSCCNQCLGPLHCMAENLLCLLTMVGVALGIVLGVALKVSRPWTEREIMYVDFPGDIFLDMLNCLVLPLVTSCLVMAVGTLDTKLSGKAGLYAVSLYLTTTALALILGIALVLTIRPGEGSQKPSATTPEETNRTSMTVDSILDLVRNIFPPNIAEATMKQRKTELEPNNSTDISLWKVKVTMTDHSNILGVVVFSLVVGVTLARLKERGKPLLDVFTSFFWVTMDITKLVIWFAPVGILFQVAARILEMDDVLQTLRQLLLYIVTVMLALFVHILVTEPVLFYAFTRRNPYRFLCNMSQAMATAFATSSSSATLPVTMECLEQVNGVDPRVSRFVLPIGAKVNMDGTALYEAVAAIFIAQVNAKPLTLVEVVLISITATAASVGAAGIPQAGLVTMVMVLNVANLPKEGISLILMVDWMLDRFRTAINVMGDAFVAGIVDHLMAGHFEEMDRQKEQA